MALKFVFLAAILCCDWSFAYGKTQCSTCHPGEAARFSLSPMGRTFGLPESLSPGLVKHVSSGSEVAIEFRNGKMLHRLRERGVTATYPVAYQIGSGVKGRTYVVKVGDYLLESPVSWYRDHGWDISPGYEAMQLIDFDRPVTESCLFCHAGETKFSDADKRKVAPDSVGPITCERCHGNGDAHMQQPSTGNIVNPAKLSSRARDSVCEQCHLEGEARIVNPGKSLGDFHAGDKIEDTFVAYLLGRADENRPAVSQVEELAKSRCVRASGGKLWCGSCHDPHGQPLDGDQKAARQRQVKAVCSSCHAQLSQRSHPASTRECVSCHMPGRSTTNIAHVAVTDHRIHRPGDMLTPSTELTNAISEWQPAPEQFRQRDLAVAELQIGLHQQKMTMVQDGVRLLESLPEKQQSQDPDALSLLENIYLRTSPPPKALALSEWAEAADPKSASFALNLGIALKRMDRAEPAERQMLRAIALDPSLMQAYAELATLYDQENRPEDARKIIDRFLQWNPQSIQFQLARKH